MESHAGTSDGPASPSRARWIAGLWLCGLTCVLYLDRICMAQAIVPIQQEFGLGNRAISLVMMAFTLAYGLCEIPAGRLGDRMGSRLVLVRIVVWWSAFTMLTGACTGFYTLLVVRFLFGAGEAGAFPNAARVISAWFPVAERGKAQGIMLAAAQVGGVLAPAATAWLIEQVGWRYTFVLFGVLGGVWAAGFRWWFRDDPATHVSVNPAELALIRGNGAGPAIGNHGAVPWRAVVANRGVLSLAAVMILACFYTYFFYSWFPKYLVAARGVGNLRAGNLASLVLAGSAVGMLLGGWLADRISRGGGDPLARRRALAAGCYALAALLLWLGSWQEDPLALSALWGASFMAMHVTLPNWWVVAIPQCGSHVGAISGLLNGIGVFGAMASQWFVGAFTDWRAGMGHPVREQWDPMFSVYVIVLLLAGLAWWSYRFSPIAGDEKVTPPENAASPSG